MENILAIQMDFHVLYQKFNNNNNNKLMINMVQDMNIKYLRIKKIQKQIKMKIRVGNKYCH